MPKQIQHSILVEDHPDGYTGPKFLTLIEYGDDSYITIIDHVTNTTVTAYVLDHCKANGIDDAAIVSLVHSNWHLYEFKPVSVLFGVLGISPQMSRIHRTFSVGDVSRVIGRFPTYDLSTSRTVKRRRRREVDPDIWVRLSKYVVNEAEED